MSLALENREARSKVDNHESPNNFFSGQRAVQITVSIRLRFYHKSTYSNNGCIKSCIVGMYLPNYERGRN